MGFEGMDKELLESAKACTSIEELRACCADQGIELSDEELSEVAGGVQFAPDFICTLDGPCLGVSALPCGDVLA